MTRHQYVENTPTTVVCVATHQTDPDRPRTARHGLLCEGHYRSLEQLLAELPALLHEVERDLPTSSSGLGPKISGNPERALPFNTGISDALADARAHLASWCQNILDDHPDRLHAPAVEHLSHFLLRHLPWAVAQPWAGDYLEEMRALRGALRAALTVSRTRRVPLGPCDHAQACDLVTHAETPCTGTLTAIVHTVDEKLPGAITCPQCGATYEPAAWRALARRLRGGAESWLTYAQLSQVLRVPVGTLKRWASEDVWRRLEGRPTRYHHGDAQRSYDQRRLDVTA